MKQSKKAEKLLKARRDAYDANKSKDTVGTKRPGSLKRKK